MFQGNTEKIFMESVEKRRIPFSVTLHIIPTAFGLNWNTPKDILISVIKNKLQLFKARWPIGHVSLELCDGDSNISYIGQSTQEFQEFQKQIFKSHAGFGVLTTDVAGSLQDINELKANYGKMMTKPHQISYATFILPPEKFKRLKNYTEEFDKNKGWHRYGLHNRPLLGEGAGCSAFASSCFQAIGLSTLAENWSRTLYIPERLIGSAENPVHIFKLLREGSLNWTTELEPSYKLHFYDPELMWKWYLRPDVQKQAIKSYQVAQAKGIILDYSNQNFETELDWQLAKPKENQ